MGTIITYEGKDYRVLGSNLSWGKHSLIEMKESSFPRIIHVNSEDVLPLIKESESKSKTKTHHEQKR